MTDTAGEDANQEIEAILAQVDRQWQAMGVLAAERATMTADLRVELTAAGTEGVPPRQLTGDDLRAFARDLAAGAQVGRVPFEWRRLLLGTLIGAVPGLILAWFVIWRWWTVPLPFVEDYSSADDMIRWLGCAAIFLIGVLYGAHRALRDVGAARRRVSALAAMLPIAGGIAIIVTTILASYLDYSMHPLVITTEAATVACILLAATVLARWWAVRPVPGSASPEPIPPRQVSV
jgi:hypothetical protein